MTREVLPEYDSARRPLAALEELRDLFSHLGLVSALFERTIKVRYKRSILGIAWSMAGPAGMMLILTIVFSRVFARDAPAYPAFLLPGLLLWNFFSQTTASVIAETAGGMDLSRRIRIPKTAQAVASILTGLFHLACALVPLLAILVVLGRPLGPALLTLPVVLFGAALFTLGVALAVSSVALSFPDASDVYGVALAGLLYATPIIYPSSILPAEVRRVVAWNPLTLYVESFRAPLYENAAASPGALATGVAVGAAMLAVGWIAYCRRLDEIPYRG